MQGKIIKGIAGFYYVNVVESGVYECKAKGVFRKEKIKPLVGDNVRIEILDEENIIDSSTTIKSEGTVKDRIYVNNLTLSEDLGDGDVTLSNCVVLGTLNVNGDAEDSQPAETEE